ncbi:DNA methyltransferase [uncultured Megasphaera sp.]|uniref:DNA methyltransferase n=1 Tax=uncultured Megasphaera sp. TaxID=165188 RepID=UPI0026164AA0|nr:DNA methyltransferase [uncultured Megasphaera sp.]
MTDAEQRAGAKLFVQDWTGRGYEKGQSQPFWLALLRDIFGIAEPEKYISFEEQVKLDHTSFIDAYIPATHVMIEQKSLGKDMRKGIRQSDGSVLSPLQQAKRYAAELPYSQRPRYIVTCNFSSFLVYDMENPQGEAAEILLENLPDEYYRLSFLVKEENEHIQKEIEISVQAGNLVGKLYDALLQKYIAPDDEETLKDLNILCVRIVFCLYAEDAGIFGAHGMFHDYLARNRQNCRRALLDLFRVLDTKIEDRDPYMDDELAAFPYVNGGLFAKEDVTIPKFDDTIIDIILRECSEQFNWSHISPTIFGAVFESTLNPDTRRSGGMHYTSIENIHKVIDPLFLDELRDEFQKISEEKRKKERNKKLRQFQDKLASLNFLDPACGSGNFLTETYMSLRKLENEVISLLNDGSQVLGGLDNPIKVQISQFYGIEINDFAVTVAKTALWIAESQMMKETELIVHMELDFLPLTTNAYIVEGNALRMDWGDVIAPEKLNYIMGNPPFVGLALRTKSQQEDMNLVFKNNKLAGRLDYVAAWYKKAAEFMINIPLLKAAFVSTNSIVQGEQVPILWTALLDELHMEIKFAYRSFIWQSESNERANVHCVIIGFGLPSNENKIIFENGRYKYVKHINGYLVDAPNMFIHLRGKAQQGYPKLVQGNKPWDGGYLILSQEMRDFLLDKYPQCQNFIKLYIGSREFINGKRRYCLWLKDVPPNEYRNIPEIRERLEMVRRTRQNTKTIAVQKQAEIPMLFSQIRQPDTDYILIPETSSSSRKYIPIGFMDKNIIASNSTLVAKTDSLYLFGILTSNVHMAWVKTLCGRLKSDYRYSPSLYNNFPWPTPTDEQKARIEETAQGILNARALYPDASLADLYDELAMPLKLLNAHRENDKAVITAYGWNWRGLSESECVARLMKLYQQMSSQS